MNLAQKLKDFRESCSAIDDFQKGAFFYQRENDARANLLVERGYIIPYATRVHTFNAGEVWVDHYRYTDKGEHLQMLINLPHEISVAPLKLLARMGLID